LGIGAEEDKNFGSKMKGLLTTVATHLLSAYPDHQVLQEFRETIDELLKIFDKPQTKVNGWELRPPYQVTTLYLGENGSKMQSPIYKNFVQDKPVNVVIRGVIMVPGKVMAGVCFPETEIESEFPHMTLALGQWQAANSAIEATCKEPFHPFYELYTAAKSSETDSAINHNFTRGVTINQEKCDAYFMLLEKPVEFAGALNAFYC
jgi:hypothetical protein